MGVLNPVMGGASLPPTTTTTTTQAAAPHSRKRTIIVVLSVLMVSLYITLASETNWVGLGGYMLVYTKQDAHYTSQDYGERNLHEQSAPAQPSIGDNHNNSDSSSSSSSPSLNPRRRAIIAAHHNEDTGWFNALSGIAPVVIMGPGDLPMNRGNEAMAYLTYLIENYDNLPESMVFLHSHAEAWHTRGIQTDFLRTIDCWEDVSYASINKDLGIGIVYLTEEAKGEPLREQEAMTAAAWKDNPNLEVLFGMPMPGALRSVCCASFMVNRKAVLSRPKHVYVDLRQWIMEGSIDGGSAGRVMEYTWHVLFSASADNDNFDWESHNANCKSGTKTKR